MGAASVLANPQPWTQQPGDGSMMDVNPQQMTSPPPNMQPQQPQVSMDPSAGQGGPSLASQIENHAAAVHHSRLAGLLDAVGGILGGNQTLRMVKNPDGSVDLQQVDSTRGEKWGRVAQAALRGAATGFAVGQGPGGAQRAAAASIQQGMAEPQVQKDKTIAEADHYNDQNQKRQLFNANMASMHQQLVKAQFDNMAAPVRFSKELTQNALELRDQVTKMGGEMIAEYSTPDELAAHVNSSGQIMDAHLGNSGMLMPITTYDKDGKVTGGQIWHIPEDKRYQLNTAPQKVPFTKINNDGTTETTFTDVPKGMMTNEQLMGAQTASQVQGNTATSQAHQLRTAQETADATKQNAATTASLAPSEINLRGAQAGEASAGAELKRAQAGALPKAGAGASIMGPDGKPLTGEAYLQGAGLDPSSFNQIRSAANGDVLIPPPGTRNPQAQALRNAVMNYDPTYTDARYATKQNFKTKGDATLLGNQSTALAHLEEAKAHQDYLSPFGTEGVKYQKAITNFTNESGKLIASGVLSDTKYKDLKDRMDSNVPYIRKAALDETVQLLSGRVKATFEKYRRGAQQDIPVHEFFDPDTQARLTRYGLAPAATGPQSNTPATVPGAPVQSNTPATVPGGQNQGGGKGTRRLADAMALPQNQGRKPQDVQQEMQSLGYQVVP